MRGLTRLCIFALGALVPGSLAGGCSRMREQLYLKEMEPSPVFEDQQSVRPPIPGTVARPTVEPVPARVDSSAETLARGRERYNIYCSPCHGLSGHGDGVIVYRGLPAPPSYHIERLRDAPDQHFLNVISNGYGRMYSYANRVRPADRVAIVAYIRALQLSQNAPVTRLSAADLDALDRARRGVGP